MVIEPLQRPPELPTGTVTFLFTDIEGSTRLIQALGERYLPVLQEHRRIIESAAEREGGTPFGTEGDAVFVAFSDAASAVRAAVGAQRELAAHAWPDDHPVRVRMGIHTGDVVLAGADYVGLALHRVARISALAHGGQILVSETSRSLAVGSLTDSLELRDIGEHRLRDMGRPERLYQVVARDLPTTFPPLRGIEAKPNNLPPQLTTFVGRAEVDEARRLLAANRLLTLTGPGGTGKTRLALQLASETMDEFPEGVYFVALDAVDDAELVPSAIAHGLGLEVGSSPPLDRIVEHLAERRVLLVLDNFEQVVDAAPAVTRLVRETARTKIVITSRIVLRAYGEQEFLVPPLATPEPAPSLTAEVAAQSEAVRLFVERAASSAPSFQLTDQNAPIVAEIVRRLDGLPLAIELAAARSRVLPLEALRARLDTRLSVLTGGARDLPARQQTLRGAIDWSYDLLDEPDRRLFERFGVFAGGACLTQTEAVCGPGSELGRDVLDGLSSLADKSLLRSLPDMAVEPRFAMLATIREYAQERSASRGETDALRRKHAEVYLALVESVSRHLTGPQRRRLLDRLGIDHDNFRAAFDWAEEAGETELALRLGSGLWRFWQARGHLIEGRDRIERALAMPGVAELEPAVVARAHAAAGGLAYWQADSALREHYEAELEAAERSGDRRLIAEALYNSGFGQSAITKTGVSYELGRTYFEKALSLFVELGDELGIANANWALALSDTERADLDAAERHCRESLAQYEAVGDPFGAGWARHVIGLVEMKQGRLDQGEEQFRAALAIFAAAFDKSAIVILLLDLAILAGNRGQTDRYWQLAGASRALQEATGAGLAATNLEFLDWRQPDSPVGDPQAEAAWAAGYALPIEEAIELARSGTITD